MPQGSGSNIQLISLGRGWGSASVVLSPLQPGQIDMNHRILLVWVFQIDHKRI